MRYSEDDIMVERFTNYLDEKLKDIHYDQKWYFYNELLEKAKKISINYSGYCPPEMQADKAEAKKRNDAMDAIEIEESRQKRRTQRR